MPTKAQEQEVAAAKAALDSAVEELNDSIRINESLDKQIGLLKKIKEKREVYKKTGQPFNIF